MRDWTRDDPVRDAEDHANREDKRPVIGTCPICQAEIHGESDGYYADEAYQIDGWWVCEDHVFDFLKKRGAKL